MKNGTSRNINDEKFIQNRRKRKNPDKLQKKREKNQKNTSFKTTLIVLGVLIALLVAFIGSLLFIPGAKGAFLKHMLASVSKAAGVDNENDISSLHSGVSHTIVSDDGKKGTLDENVYTFLATGTDFSGNLTDVIMVAKFDTGKGKIDILQIPRDTYVQLSGKLKIDDNGHISPDNFKSGYGTKINSVFVTGKNHSAAPISNLLKDAEGKSNAQIKNLCEGKKYSYLGVTPSQVTKYLEETDKAKRKELMSSMQKNFGIKYLCALIYYSYGIPVDYYAQVNTAGFRNIVDAIGGVDLYVPQNMYHNDPTQNLYINLKKGQQHLDGDKAEQFVRFRGYTLGDIDRIDAQKTFINAFMNKLFSVSSVTKVNDIIEVVQKNLFTNLTLQETANFAIKVLDTNLSSGFTITTLPGGPVDAYTDGIWISYYGADKAGVMKLVNESFNKYDTALPESMFGLHTIKQTAPPVSSAPSSDEDENDTVNTDSSDTPITDNDGNNTDIPDNEADVSGDNNGENVADDDIPSEESNAEDESEENTEAENSDSDENEDSGLTEDNDIETDNEVSDTSEEAQAPSSDNNSEDNSEDTPSAIDELLKMAA